MRAPSSQCQRGGSMSNRICYVPYSPQASYDEDLSKLDDMRRIRSFIKRHGWCWALNMQKECQTRRNARGRGTACSSTDLSRVLYTELNAVLTHCASRGSASHRHSPCRNSFHRHYQFASLFSRAVSPPSQISRSALV